MFGSKQLIQARGGCAGIDRLRGVGVERARVDVGAVRSLGRPGFEPTVNHGAHARVGIKAGSFTGEGHKNVAVDVAAGEALGCFHGGECVLPQSGCVARPEQIVSRWFDCPGLEKATSAEDAVAMCPVDLPMRVFRVPHGANMKRAIRRNPIFGAIVARGGIEFRNNRRRHTGADVQFLLNVVVERVDENVFVAPGLARLRVGLAQDRRGWLCLPLIRGLGRGRN